MQNELQRVINLAKKTGDRVIVFDYNKPENTYVVMGLDEYEKLAIGRHEVRGLTEDELLDKINRDIAIWKSDNDFSLSETSDRPKEAKKVPTPAEGVDLVGKKPIKKSNWSIPKTVKEAAAETMEENMDYEGEVNF